MRENCDSVVVAMDGGEFAKVMDAETISQMAQGECAYEGSFNEMVADELVAAFDEKETPEDFWAKHDKQHHHGHYDPATQRCSLREEAKAEEERREGEDRETDDLGGESPDGGREGPLVSEEEDAAYLEAVGRGDMETAARMVREVAAKAIAGSKVVDENGNPMVVHHGTNNEFSVFDKSKLGSKNALAESAYKGFFFARSLETAQNYTGLNRGDLALDAEAQALLESIKDRYEYGKAESEFEAAHRAAKAEYGRRNGMPDEQILRNFLKGTVLNEKAIQRAIDDMQRLWWYTEAANGKSNLDNFEEAFKGTAEHRRFDELGKKIWDEFSNADLKRRGYKPHVMDLYLGIKNPLVYDFEGKGRDLTFADLIDKAKAEGHDGCIFKNVADGADIDEIYVAFDSNQIKSADPVTYDDDGKVIPLSRRFDGGDDIRGDVRAGGVELKPRKMGISRIFTGSAADYGKPSLLKVGTGEGSQVYGWGLYGSDQKGVAESYAAVGTDKKGYTGYSKGGRLIRTNEGSGDIESDAATMLALYGDLETAKKEALGFPNGEAIARELEEHGAEYREEWPHAVVYEQTFFTDREPGDESHLLKWYEPVSEEQLEWITDALDKENLPAAKIYDALWDARRDYEAKRWVANGEAKREDVIHYGAPLSGKRLYELVSQEFWSPKFASEFLARAGIDGVKYPVDSYGGKGVKDGDKAGWNYVSFRDDNIRIDRKYVDGQKVFDYQELMGKRLPGVDALSVLNRISKMGSKEAMAAEFRRILASGKVTEDSLNEVMALAIEAAFGLDGREVKEPKGGWGRHVKRYHPKGITANTQCIYLNGQRAQGGVGEVQCKRPGNGITFEEAKRWFKENGNIDVFHAETEDDLDYMGLNTSAKKIMQKGEPLTQQEHEAVVCAICEECKSLRERFPNIQLGFDVIYPYDLCAAGAGGMSSLDRRSGFGYLTVGPRERVLSQMGTTDARMYEYTIRHEIGHSLSSQHISETFDEKVTAEFVKAYGETDFRRFLNTVCNIGDAWLDAPDEKQKAYAKEEIIADSFALYTTPGYRKGLLPSALEEVCKEMVDKPQIDKQNGVWALDEREKREEGKKALGYVDGLVEMTALHNPPKDKTRPYALNCLEGKWEFFDTEEERDEWLKWHDAECSKTTMEEARAWIAQELPRIKAHIRGKDKDAEGEGGFNGEAADAIEAAFGLGQDALDPRDPDFWMKHDRAKHGGHFDPDTMSCELREEMGLPTVKNRGERDAAKAREDAKVDDLGGETPQDNIGTGVDAKKAALANAIGKAAPKMDAGQMVDAVEWMARKPTATQDVANSAKTLKNKSRRTSKVSAQDFHKAISLAKEARSAADRWRVDVHPVEDYEQDECYMSEGGSTFAIADGDIISVCKNPTDTQCSGVDLMREAVEAGGKKLDSYEGNHRFYVKCGFKPVAWTKFNPDYAEPGTPPEDVIFYIYTGEARKMSPEDAVADIERFKGETQAMEYMDAGSYRDSLLGQ